MKVIKAKFGDNIYEFVTIGEIAKQSGRTLSVVRKYMERGILPESNLRTPPIKTDTGALIKGTRIYTVQLAEKVVRIIKTFRQGIPVTEEQRSELNKAFMDEKILLNL